MIRLFTAVELPAELRRRMAQLCTGVDKARWVPEENLHLTLRFIGEVAEDLAEDIAAELDAVRAAPFPLTLSGAGHFESGRRVRTLWLGVEKSEALTALYDRIDAAVQRAGLPPEGRRFHPHITLARFRNGRPAAVRGWLAANGMFRAVPIMVERFVLFSSHLRSEGALYRPEVEFPLGRK